MYNGSCLGCSGCPTGCTAASRRGLGAPPYVLPDPGTYTPYVMPATNPGGSAGVTMVLPNAATGFAVAGPPGAAVGAVVGLIPAVKDWLTGHSSLYEATVAAIPVYGDEALKGDVSAYIVLHAWSGDQIYCRYAIDYAHTYYLGTQVGQSGPCGAADASSKAAARAQWQKVDAQRPDVKATAYALVTGQPVPAPTASSSGQPPLLLPNTTTPALASLGMSSTTVWLVGAAVLGYFLFAKRGH